MTQDNRSPEQIERDLEATRRRMDDTLTALQTQYNPGALTQRAITEMRENGAIFGRNFGATLRDNPLPVTMLGISLAWLMAGSGGPSSDRVSESGTSLRERGGEMAGKARASGAAAGSQASVAGERLNAGAARGRQQAAAAGQSMSRFYEDYPIAAGAMALALGAVAAAVLPRSRMEEETLGPYRDQARERLQAEAGAAMRQAQEKAGSTAQEAVETARQKKEEKKADLSGRTDQSRRDSGDHPTASPEPQPGAGLTGAPSPTATPGPGPHPQARPGQSGA